MSANEAVEEILPVGKGWTPGDHAERELAQCPPVDGECVGECVRLQSIICKSEAYNLRRQVAFSTN